MLKFTVKRGKNLTYDGSYSKYDHAPGILSILGEDFYTVEDIVRDPGAKKVYGLTAIPMGTYNVKWTFSPKFQRHTLQLMNVPGFEGIRIHSANFAHELEGCIAPGNQRYMMVNKQNGLQFNAGVGDSRNAVKRIEELCLAELNKGGEVWVSVS